MFGKMEPTLNTRKSIYFCGCKACIWEKWDEKESSMVISLAPPILEHTDLFPLPPFPLLLMNLQLPQPALQMLFKGEN